MADSAVEHELRLKEKVDLINLVLLEPDVDLWKLRELALTEGGLVNDEIRKKVWPKLVGVSFHKGSSLPEEASFPSLKSNVTPLYPHMLELGSLKKPKDNLKRKSPKVVSLDYDQINLDVARCTWHLLTGEQRLRQRQLLRVNKKKAAKLLRRKQKRLSDMINITLVSSYPDTEDKLRYYQGYHDVASIFMSTLGGLPTVPSSSITESSTVKEIACSKGLDLPSRILRKISHSHFKEQMRMNFLLLQTAIRLVLFPLLSYLDPEVHNYLRSCDMEPFFALSWVITWYSHDVRDTNLVKRLFDFFIVSHPLMPIYTSVAMILHPINRAEILATECDFAELHQVLANLPKNSSMVGWKWRIDLGGYVSDDEVEDEGSTSVAEFTDSNILSNSRIVVSNDQNLFSKDEDLFEESDATSLISSLSMGPASRVSFQDLIDMSLSFMSRVPPRNLLNLASKYYSEEQMAPMLLESPKITLFWPPPSWAMNNTTKADWVHMQRARVSARFPIAKKLRTEGDNITIDKQNYVDRRSLALIAVGQGPGEEEYTIRKRRRNVMLLGGAAMTFAAVALVLAIYYGRASDESPVIGENSGRDNPIRTRPTANSLFSTKDVSLECTSAPQNKVSAKEVSTRTTYTTTKSQLKLEKLAFASPPLQSSDQENKTRQVSSLAAIKDATPSLPNISALLMEETSLCHRLLPMVKASFNSSQNKNEDVVEKKKQQQPRVSPQKFVRGVTRLVKKAMKSNFMQNVRDELARNGAEGIFL